MKQKKEDIQQEKANADTAEEFADAGTVENTASGCNTFEETEGKTVSQPEAEVNKEVEELKKQCEDNFSRLMRMQADFDNYKKRVAKERDDMYFSALETIVTQILPVVDNMERAAAAFRGDQLDDKYIEGVEMVFKQLIGVLAKNGLKEIEAQDKDFDPNLHHAVMQAEGEAEEENKIKEVFQKGYMLGSKVIRPSMVKVIVK